MTTPQDAINYIQRYPEAKGSVAPATKYEIDIRYNTGDTIHAICQSKGDAVKFLKRIE